MREVGVLARTRTRRDAEKPPAPPSGPPGHWHRRRRRLRLSRLCPTHDIFAHSSSIIIAPIIALFFCVCVTCILFRLCGGEGVRRDHRGRGGADDAGLVPLHG